MAGLISAYLLNNSPRQTLPKSAPPPLMTPRFVEGFWLHQQCWWDLSLWNNIHNKFEI